MLKGHTPLWRRREKREAGPAAERLLNAAIPCLNRRRDSLRGDGGNETIAREEARCADR